MTTTEVYEVRVDLTDAEWMSIIDMERDGLPACCGSISDLRDDVISLARNSGRLYRTTAEMLIEDYDDAIGRHSDGEPMPVLDKLIAQVREALTRFPDLPHRPPVPAGEPLVLGPLFHVHGYDGGPMPEPCTVEDCDQWPRQVDIEIADGGRGNASWNNVRSRKDGIARDLLEVRATLGMLSALREKDVPFYDNVTKAHAASVRAIAALHPYLFPKDHNDDN
jgi:hypothetical protein